MNLLLLFALNRIRELLTEAKTKHSQPPQRDLVDHLSRSPKSGLPNERPGSCSGVIKHRRVDRLNLRTGRFRPFSSLKISDVRDHKRSVPYDPDASSASTGANRHRRRNDRGLNQISSLMEIYSMTCRHLKESGKMVQ